MAKNLVKKFAFAAGLAALAGYITGILTAPKSGKETRADVKHAAMAGMSEAEKQLKKVVAELGDLLDEAKKRGSAMTGKAEKELNELVDRARTAREKAREMVSAVHDGDAEDEDLKHAVDQANGAIKHLKTYLKK